jgi:hypothetical protein
MIRTKIVFCLWLEGQGRKWQDPARIVPKCYGSTTLVASILDPH